jgi:hypothetical protein
MCSFTINQCRLAVENNRITDVVPMKNARLPGAVSACTVFYRSILLLREPLPAVQVNPIIASILLWSAVTGVGHYGHGPGQPLDRFPVSPSPALSLHLYIPVHRRGETPLLQG